MTRRPPTGKEPAATTTEMPSLGEALFGPFWDAWLAARTRFTLLARLGTDAAEVGVEAFRGNVILAGDVGRSETRDEAERIVRTSAGVHGVSNRIRVRGAHCLRPGTTDAEIRTTVNAELRNARTLRGSIVTVESVYDGVVRLAGAARNAHASTTAFDLAVAVPGVRRVIDDVVLQAEYADDAAA